MKINLPGIHGGISQQSPHLRLQNQHSDASNVVFDVLDGMRTRWGTQFLGNQANNMYPAIGTIETTDGKLWLVSWTGTKFNFMDFSNPTVTYSLTPAGSYMPTGALGYQKVRTLPILDTIVVTNVDKVVASSTATETAGSAIGMVYIPQVFEGLDYNFEVTMKTTKAGALPVGSNLLSATITGTIVAGDTPNSILTAIQSGGLAAGTYHTAGVSGNILTISPTAAALAMEPELIIQDTSGFAVKVYGWKKAPKVSASDTTYYVTTTKSYEDLPPNPTTGFTFVITDGYYVTFDGATYVESPAPGLRTKLDKTTMPHELRYDPALLPAVPWTFGPVNDYDSWSRLVGDNTSAPLPQFVGKTLNSVFFYRNRLGLLSDNYVALSAVGKYYNWFPETSQEVTDSDPIVVFPTSVKFSELLWAVPFGKQLILLSASKQYVLHSGYEALTSQTIAVDEATNYKLLPQIEPLVLEASLVLAVDHGSYAGILEYKLDDQQIATEGSLLSSVVPEFIPSTIDQMIYIQSEHMILMKLKGSPTVYVYKFNKREDGQVTQMAWSKWTMIDTGISTMVSSGSSKVYMVTGPGDILLMDTKVAKTAVAMDHQQTISADNGDALPSNTTVAIVAATGKELEVTGGNIVTDSTDPVSVICGRPINWSLTLSPMVLRDDNGLPRADLDATIENMTVDWEGGAFGLTISGQGLPSRTKTVVPDTTTMSSVTTGTSLTEVTPTRFLVMAPAKRVTLTLSGSAYFPVRINNISYNLYVTKDRG